jgi:hypoxanthine phosphoribosyltransferase
MTKLGPVVLTRGDIARRVRELGRAIEVDYAGTEPVLIPVLPGATVLVADLIREIDLPLQVHPIAISGFGPGHDEEERRSSQGRVRIVLDVEVPLTDRDAILVQDVIDTGLTTRYVLATLREREPNSLEVCTLLSRSARRIAPVTPRYLGFPCPDPYVVGYGLGVERRHRGLPDVHAIDDRVPQAGLSGSQTTDRLEPR